MLVITSSFDTSLLTLIAYLCDSGQRKMGENYGNLTARPFLLRISFALVFTLLVLWYISPFNGAGENQLEKEPLQNPERKRNVIFIVSDGMGPASLALTRGFRQYNEGSDSSTLNLDKYFIGNSRTRSSDSLITDSAAGATAYSCALKSYNGAIGVTPEGLPCATVLEAAKLDGYATGLVVTTRITDATPASFASHARDRSEEDFIAEQLVLNKSHPFGTMVDVLIGGGRCHFYGCRGDERNILEEAQQEGWTYSPTLNDDLDNITLPYMALVASHDVPYELDRNPNHYPSLKESALSAVRLLDRETRGREKGFFLLVEGSRIDHAGHSNDPAAQVHEVQAYDDTVEALVQYSQESDTETIVISTSDHETGGLSVARQVTVDYPDYAWFPEVLANASHSTAYLSSKIRHNLPHLKSDAALRNFLIDVLQQDLGIPDPQEDEIDLVFSNARVSAHDALAVVLSRRAQIGWSTHGHSAVEVNVYGFSNRPHAIDDVRGSNENIEVGKFLQNYLNLDVAELTPALRKGFGDNF